MKNDGDYYDGDDGMMKWWLWCLRGDYNDGYDDDDNDDDDDDDDVDDDDDQDASAGRPRLEQEQNTGSCRWESAASTVLTYYYSTLELVDDILILLFIPSKFYTWHPFLFPWLYVSNQLAASQMVKSF